MFRRSDGRIEVLLGHPGGPYWADRDAGAWSIPKGGVNPGEEHLDAAIREFKEETGFDTTGPFVSLGSVTQKSGKRVYAWAVEGECDPAQLVSNTTIVEWPPRSGRRLTVPELDRVQFFSLADARVAINPAQVALLDTLEDVQKDKG